MEYFDIDSATGEVSVKNVFDYEEVKIVNVTITAQDNGIPRLSGSVSLFVYIEDVNDNTPVFEEGKRYTIFACAFLCLTRRTEGNTKP